MRIYPVPEGVYCLNGDQLDEIRALRIAGRTVAAMADNLIRVLEHPHLVDDETVIDLRHAAD